MKDDLPYYQDIFYDVNERLFYAIQFQGEIHTIDFNGPSPVIKVITRLLPKTTFYTRYIVRAPWGDLLQVLMYYYDGPSSLPPYISDSDDDEFQSNNQVQYDPHDMDEEDDSMDELQLEEDEAEGYPTRGKVSVYTVDLAKQKASKIKSLQDHALFIGFNHTFMVNSRDFPNIRPNCVYISDDNSTFIYCNPFNGRKLAYVNLEDDSLTTMSFSDSLIMQWPPPVWFRPNLT
ncbi:unnamed protein product [Urochloa humidicola]